VSFVWDGDDLLNDYIAGGVSVRYDVLDGEVLGHKGGANRYLYVPDPLGSVNHILDTSQNVAGTYVYWPYGEVQSHTGANTPMQFVGALGYYTAAPNRVYVRARWYRPDLGRWQTREPADEAEDGYLYGQDAVARTGGPNTTLPTPVRPRVPVPRNGHRRLPVTPAQPACGVSEGLCRLVSRCSIVVGLLCLPKRAGPRKEFPDCKDYGSSWPHPGDLPCSYDIRRPAPPQPYPPGTSRRACEGALAETLRRVRAEYGVPDARYAGCAPATGGPCPDEGLHCRVKSARHKGFYVSVVCCPTCDDTVGGLPVFGCSCEIDPSFH